MYLKRLMLGDLLVCMNLPKTSVTKEWNGHTTGIHVLEIYVAYKDYFWMMELLRR